MFWGYNDAMKNTHLEHLEDEILNRGSEGGKDVIEYLEQLGNFLHQRTSEVEITTKWDGAPAIICGVDPSNGKFFVGTKSVFNKTNPKVCYTDEIIDQYYSGQLAQKLKACLQNLPQLGIKGVIQGDLLFTDDKKILHINGERVISFTPNTITYTVPFNTQLCSKISAAKVGIVFHTKYVGESLAEMAAQFGVDISKLQKTPDVFVASANFTDPVGSSRFNALDRMRFSALINRARGSLKQASSFLDAMKNDGDIAMPSIFKIFFNSYVREGKRIVNANKVVSDFARFYSAYLQKEVDSKKTKAAKTKYLQIKNRGLAFIQTHKRSIYMTVASYINLIEAKNFVIRRLEKAKSLGTFIRTSNGYKVTTPEGFVAIRNGKAIKLVDRLEFSKNNFNVEKNWDKK